MAASERAGYHVDGQECDAAEVWSNNIAHSTYIGVLLLEADGLPDCTLISGFSVWKSFDFGIYVQVLMVKLFQMTLRDLSFL